MFKFKGRWKGWSKGQTCCFEYLSNKLFYNGILDNKLLHSKDSNIK